MKCLLTISPKRGMYVDRKADGLHVAVTCTGQGAVSCTRKDTAILIHDCWGFLTEEWLTSRVIAGGEGDVEEGHIAAGHHQRPIPEEAEPREHRILDRHVCVADHHCGPRQFIHLLILHPCKSVS